MVTRSHHDHEHHEDHGGAHSGGHGADYMVHHHRDVQGGTARAAVFGVSDGLVSNVALILGVAAAGTDSATVLVAGLSGLLAGAASMAAGEYVSVTAQNELVEREIEIERRSLAERPEEETEELKQIYIQRRGLEEDKAETLAQAVMADPEVALDIHAREELGIDPESGGNAVGAAVSSFGAFAIGAVVPLVPWFVLEGTWARNISVLVGLIGAAAVGATLAYFTERSMFRTATRQVLWAVAACVLTWGIGSVLGATVV